MLLMFARYLPLHRTQFVEESLRLVLRRRLAVPTIIALYLADTLAGNGVRENHGRFFIDSFRLFACGDELWDIVAVYFQYMPIESFILIAQRFERHDALGVTVYLDIIP